MMDPDSPWRIVLAGHSGAGKSTLASRLLHAPGASSAGKLPLVFHTPGGRAGVLIDPSGHEHFLKEMLTGAARADGALLLIAADEDGREQSQHQACLLCTLGLRQVAVVVNKMDLAGYDAAAFAEIERHYRAFLAGIGLEPRAFVPVSACAGQNVAAGAATMPWYTGPTVAAVLDEFVPPEPAAAGPLRLPVQDVCRLEGRRIVAGRVESGTLRVGEEVVFSPCNKTATVASIERWPRDGNAAPGVCASARAGESVGITLVEQIFVERGHVVSHREDAPIESNRIKASVFWHGRHCLSLHGHYRLKLATQEIECEVSSIERVIDAATLVAPEGAEAAGPQTVTGNEVAELTLQLRKPLVLDNHDRVPALGRFALLDGNEVSGGGIIFGGVYTDRRQVVSQNITWSASQITARHRARRNGHRGAIVWLTGLSGSGKSTIAQALENELFLQHYHVYVLDGDNIRYGLNSNLGFSPEDRIENIRRVSEVARLMADAGYVVVTAFISPYRTDRRRAREIALEGGCEFVEVYVNASLEVCEIRDPKQLYKKARAGQIKQFTGIDAPYEEPEDAEIVVETGQQSVGECVVSVLEQLLPRLKVERDGV